MYKCTTRAKSLFAPKSSTLTIPLHFTPLHDSTRLDTQTHPAHRHDDIKYNHLVLVLLVGVSLFFLCLGWVLAWKSECRKGNGILWEREKSTFYVSLLAVWVKLIFFLSCGTWRSQRALYAPVSSRKIIKMLCIWNNHIHNLSAIVITHNQQRRMSSETFSNKDEGVIFRYYKFMKLLIFFLLLS